MILSELRNSIHCQRGATILEMIFAVVLLTIISIIALSAMDSFSDQLSRTGAVRSRDKQLSAILDTLRDNISLYQLNYDFDETRADEFLDVNNLPLAWNNKQVVPVAECPDCPGRMGYVAHPVNGIRGMFRVVVRLTHSELIEGHKDYEFIVSPR